jgi:peptidoglycan/xylan/chitin deacetylase (PgdA/CDA1 family)
MLRKLVLASLLILAIFFSFIYWLYSDTISQVTVSVPVVALTYDDGPNPPYTENLLDLLEKHDVKATFFPKAENIEAFPEAAIALVEGGHEIGNHSYYHQPMSSTSQAPRMAEVEHANQVIYRVMGIRAKLFRPPFGIQGIGLKRALKELEMTSILMDSAGNDWEETNPAKIAQSILESVQPGSIILLHDGHGDIGKPTRQDSRAATVDASRIIIETLRKQGYRFLTISELLVLGEQQTL